MSAIALHDGRVVRLYGYQAHFLKSEWPENMSMAVYKRITRSGAYMATTEQIERLAQPWGSIVRQISSGVPKFATEGNRVRVQFPEWINLVWLKSAPIQGNNTIPGRKRPGAAGSEMVFVWFTRTGPDARQIGKSVGGLLMDTSWDQLAQDYMG
ncbi:MAG TPA: hypothetical protein VK700_02230 [Steroidobacteraceae bacterium]|jgi:hypothetical protein|nr:hypothetical protein [Steroidobacteraceae bacterium]